MRSDFVLITIWFWIVASVSGNPNDAELNRRANLIRNFDFHEGLSMSDDINKMDLIKAVYDKDEKNYERTMQLIDWMRIEKGAVLVNETVQVLFDEMIKNGHKNTVEYVMLAWRISKRIKHETNWKIKDQLSDIFLKFEPSVRMLMEDRHFRFPTLKRDENNQATEFTLQSNDGHEFRAKAASGGRYFQFIDEKSKATLYVDPVVSKAIIKSGTNDKAKTAKTSYWQIIPLRNATAFKIENYGIKYFLSTATHTDASGKVHNIALPFADTLDEVFMIKGEKVTFNENVVKKGSNGKLALNELPFKESYATFDEIIEGIN